jgi:hypothetical protein
MDKYRSLFRNEIGLLLDEEGLYYYKQIILNMRNVIIDKQLTENN